MKGKRWKMMIQSLMDLYFPSPRYSGRGVGVRGKRSEVHTGENANVDGNGSTKLMRLTASMDRFASLERSGAGIVHVIVIVDHM